MEQCVGTVGGNVRECMPTESAYNHESYNHYNQSMKVYQLGRVSHGTTWSRLHWANRPFQPHIPPPLPGRQDPALSKSVSGPNP